MADFAYAADRVRLKQLEIILTQKYGWTDEEELTPSQEIDRPTHALVQPKNPVYVLIRDNMRACLYTSGVSAGIFLEAFSDHTSPRTKFLSDLDPMAIAVGVGAWMERVVEYSLPRAWWDYTDANTSGGILEYYRYCQLGSERDEPFGMRLTPRGASQR